MRVAVDAMGGDKAPAEIVKGVVAALDALPAEDKIVVFGDRAAIEPLLGDGGQGLEKVEIVHCSQTIGFDEHPVEALRHKRDSSILKMATAASSGEVDAVISAGNTGAMVAACQMRMRLLEGVNRPGIAVVIPTFSGPVTICDVGANVQCKPINLHQYALMGAIYSEAVLGITRPRVGLMSIGEEDAKGNELVKQVRQMLKADPKLNFQGNVEGRDVARGVVDVIACEGFVGNVILKLTEGLAEGLIKTIVNELIHESPALAKQFEPVVKNIWKRHDYNEYGGAPLLGVDGICIICHGSSNYRAIVNAVRVAREFARQGVNNRIVEDLKATATPA
jgi:glycerol-3-phosphate acyltransferase PlsX